MDAFNRSLARSGGAAAQQADHHKLMFEALETVAESFEAASISRQRWYWRFIMETVEREIYAQAFKQAVGT